MSVLYLHGLEGGPNGTKGRWVKENYCKDEETSGPQMSASLHLDTFVSDLTVVIPKIQKLIPKCAQEAKEAIENRNPKVIVASSFGAAVLLYLMQNSDIRTPSVLIAQGAVFLGVGDRLPSNVRSIVIHGEKDEVVKYETSVRLCENSGPMVDLWTIKGGDHRLHVLTKPQSALQKAIDKLLLEQGNKEEQEKARQVHWS